MKIRSSTSDSVRSPVLLNFAAIAREGTAPAGFPIRQNFDAPSGAAKGTKGQVAVTDKTVRVAIDLPFMLRVLKGTIESKVNEKLDALV